MTDLDLFPYPEKEEAEVISSVWRTDDLDIYKGKTYKKTKMDSIGKKNGRLSIF